MKKLTNFIAQSKQSNAGYTLVELLIAAAISVVVVGGAAYGLVQAMNSKKQGTEQANRRIDINRAVDFISDEVRKSESIQTDITAADAGIDTTKYQNAKVVLALNIPGVTGTAANEKVIYFVSDRPTGTPWQGPKVIYRYGPPIDSNGKYTNNTWSSEPLVDRIDTNLLSPGNCGFGNTAIAAEGFASCINGSTGVPGKMAQVLMKAKIYNNKTETYQAGTTIVARANNSPGNLVLPPIGSSFNILPGSGSTTSSGDPNTETPEDPNEIIEGGTTSGGTTSGTTTYGTTSGTTTSGTTTYGGTTSGTTTSGTTSGTTTSGTTSGTTTSGTTSGTTTYGTTSGTTTSGTTSGTTTYGTTSGTTSGTTTSGGTGETNENSDNCTATNGLLSCQQATQVTFTVLGNSYACDASTMWDMKTLITSGATTHNLSSSQPSITISIQPGEEYKLTAIPQQPGGVTCENTNNQIASDNINQVRILRNGDDIPAVAGFNNQQPVEKYLQSYTENGKIKLNNQQLIYLFEIGQTNTTASGFDLQDNVVLVSYL